MLQDIRYALRRLARSPGFTAAAVLTLALGIGANTAIFSVVNSVILKPLPFGDPSRIVQISSVPPGGSSFAATSPLDIVDIRREVKSFSSVVTANRHSFTFTAPDADPEHVFVGWVGADFFRLLQVPPLLGRVFTSAEEEEGSERVIVLAEWFWRERFGAGNDVLGRKLTLNGRDYEVIGVAPGTLNHPVDVALWRPIAFTADMLAPNTRGARWMSAMARLAPGATIESANAELDQFARGLAEQFPSSNVDRTYRARPIAETMVGDVRTPLLVLLGAVFLVTMIACANVANLMLARAAARQGEFAVRAALGAGRLRVLRQLVTESVLLSAIGGAVAMLLAWWGVELFARHAPADLPRAGEIRVDGTVLLFTAGLTVAAGLLFGLAPAALAARTSLAGSMREGGRSQLGGSSPRLRSALVVGEVAMAALLLIGAGLLLRSFAELQRVDPGFEPEGVLTFEIALPAARYADDDSYRAFATELRERLTRLPGVSAAGGSFTRPMGNTMYALSFAIEGQQAETGKEPSALITSVTPGYLEALRIPVMEGRSITDADRAGAPGVVLVNEALARLYFPGERAVGKRLRVSDGEGGEIPVDVVGVVGDVRQENLADPASPEIYHSFAQRPFMYLSAMVRASGEPERLLPQVREAVRSIDPLLPLIRSGTMSSMVSDTVATQRLYMYLLAIFAGVALALAAVGIYGVISYSVHLRNREVGLRVALGATPGSVLRMVVRQGLVLTLIGIGAGVLTAFWLTRVLASLLYGIGTTDLMTFAGVVLVLFSVALLACWIPARRASRVDPVLAMRSAE